MIGTRSSCSPTKTWMPAASLGRSSTTALGRPLPPLSVQLYNPSYDKDQFEDTAIDRQWPHRPLKVVYAGGYLDRNVRPARGLHELFARPYADYYQCNYPGCPFAAAMPTRLRGYCYSPSAFVTDKENTTHQTHELRLSTPDDWRLRALGGLFWENFTIHEHTDWLLRDEIRLHIRSRRRPAPPRNDPNVRHAGNVYFDDTYERLQAKPPFRLVRLRLVAEGADAHAGHPLLQVRKPSRSAPPSAASAADPRVPMTAIRCPDPCINVPESHGYNLTTANPAEQLHRASRAASI